MPFKSNRWGGGVIHLSPSINTYISGEDSLLRDCCCSHCCCYYAYPALWTTRIPDSSITNASRCHSHGAASPAAAFAASPLSHDAYLRLLLPSVPPSRKSRSFTIACQDGAIIWPLEVAAAVVVLPPISRTAAVASTSRPYRLAAIETSSARDSCDRCVPSAE